MGGGGRRVKQQNGKDAVDNGNTYKTTGLAGLREKANRVFSQISPEKTRLGQRPAAGRGRAQENAGPHRQAPPRQTYSLKKVSNNGETGQEVKGVHNRGGEKSATRSRWFIIRYSVGGEAKKRTGRLPALGSGS